MNYLISILLMSALILLIYLMNFSKNADIMAKSDSFECGFNSLSNPNLPFNMPFFYITLMFLIFDLELALLIFLPILNLESENLKLNTILILILITLLTFYEWEKNMINWF